MLQALIHKKLKASFSDTNFSPSEDTLTSSVLGLLQYLPSNIFLSILKEACGMSSSFPIKAEDIIEVRFWEHWEASNTTNARLVEPDVFIATESYHIIVEAKKTDEGGQYLEQWNKELIAHQNTFPDDDHRLVLYALGGNDSLTEKTIILNNTIIPIYRASWFNLLHAITNELSQKHSYHINRLLSDIINAFRIHGFFDIEWIDTLDSCSLSSKTISIFSHSNAFSKLYTNHKPLNNKFIEIWPA